MSLKTVDFNLCDVGGGHSPALGCSHEQYKVEELPSLRKFEQGIAEKTFTATVMASAMQYSLRRENLEHGECVILNNSLSSLNLREVRWCRLAEVGTSSSFSAADCAKVTEKMLEFFHAPRCRKLIFFVSSDGESVTVDVGVRDIGRFSHAEENRSALKAANNFAKAYWPGLKFEKVPGKGRDTSPEGRMKNLLNYELDGQGHRIYSSGLHALSGLPSVNATPSGAIELVSVVDKLSGGLSGRKWGYLVIAEPVPTEEINQSIFICRELAGRAESMRQFQVGASLSETISKTLTETWSESQSATEKNNQKVKANMLKAGVGVGVAVAGVAALAVACPPLIPAIVSGGEMVLGGLISSAGTCVMLSRLFNGAKTDTKGRSYSKAIAEAASTTDGRSLGETIVNKHAEAMARLLESQIKRYEYATAVGAWDTGVYFIGEDDETSSAGADILKAMVSGVESYAEPIRVHDIKRSGGAFTDDADPFVALSRFENPNLMMLMDGMPFMHPLGGRYQTMRTILHSRELSQIVNFPFANVPGVRVRRVVPDTGIPIDRNINDGLTLGKAVFRGNELAKSYALSVSGLAKHALVCGINGSGKTNTVLGILEALAEKQTPYLVIEPAKQEYVAWAIERNARLLRECRGNEAKARARQDWINVFIPGKAKWRGTELERLSLNPFDFVWLDKDSEPTVLEHIDRLKTVVNASLPMQEILPVLMEELIYKGYSTRTMPKGLDGQFACWLPTGSEERSPAFDENVRLPSFVQLKRLVPSLLRERSYAADVARNIQAALESRLGSFTRGWRGGLLNRESPRRSRSDWDALFAHPTVINLTALTSDDDKAFFMGLVMMFLYEYRQSLEEISPSGPGLALKHLLVIEEAHRILSRTENLGVGTANPKREMSAMFSNMISEVRAYGQGILIADQVPCRLNEDAVKNTNLKIVHKVVSADDREAMAKALNLWDDQVRLIGDLEVGEAIVRGDMDREPYLIKVNKNKI